ncbi:MAG: hypothetical protein LC746_11470 [Acidobacteria bacterium]|nr:hypothetical protein [Acidobacteriota bacterium]
MASPRGSGRCLNVYNAGAGRVYGAGNRRACGCPHARRDRAAGRVPFEPRDLLPLRVGVSAGVAGVTRRTMPVPPYCQQPPPPGRKND